MIPLLGVFGELRALGGVKNEDGSTNSDTNAAAPGSVIVFRATGEGMTNPPGVTGLVASGVLPAPILVARVEVGGVEAAIDFIGGEVGQVAGVLKVQARLGVATPLGRQAVVLTIGSARSQGGVYIVLG